MTCSRTLLISARSWYTGVNPYPPWVQCSTITIITTVPEIMCQRGNHLTGRITGGKRTMRAGGLDGILWVTNLNWLWRTLGVTIKNILFPNNKVKKKNGKKHVPYALLMGIWGVLNWLYLRKVWTIWFKLFLTQRRLLVKANNITIFKFLAVTNGEQEMSFKWLFFKEKVHIEWGVHSAVTR